MALKATIFKASVNIADMDRQVFFDTTLTLARHPSETDQRMMLRLLAWLCHADPALAFTKGLSASDEPEIWLHNDHQGVELSIEIGLPDEKRLRRACYHSTQVMLYAFGERAAQVWWQQNQEKLAQYANLGIRFLTDNLLAELTLFIQRNMTLQITLQEGILWLSDAERNIEITFIEWQTLRE